jgi:polyisoprenyl-teichoic acid--peptidoglycan teichoic acid transferase
MIRRDDGPPTGSIPVEQPAPAPPIAARPRRGPPIKVIVLGIVLLLLIGLAVGAILLWSRVAAFNDSVSTAPAASSALFGPLGGDERVNIAFYGYGGPTHKSGKFLADSIQILSIDPQADTTTVIPIPRDLWIEGFLELPNNGKINEVFAVGQLDGGLARAGNLTTHVLAEVTGLEIRYWVALDFAGFKAMIDAVGGVTVNNPRKFKYTWCEQCFRNGVFREGPFRRGQISLNGDQALAYARARYTDSPLESSDFARSKRQERVLSALRAKLGSGLDAIGPGLALMDGLKGQMKTNLSAFDLFLLSSHLSADRRLGLKEGRVLEATTNTIGQYILVLTHRQSPTDYRPLQRFLEHELAKPIKTPSPTASPSAVR